MEERLGQVGRKIDQAKGKADAATQEAKARVGQRIDALQARKAQLQTQLREARDAEEQAWEAAYIELSLELDEADAELAIIDAEIEAEDAADQAAYAAAVQRNIDAWNAYMDALQARAGAAKEGVRNKFGEAVSSVQQKKAAADQRLKELRQSSGEAWVTLRLADVDEEKAAFMADSQVPWGVEALGGTISEAAWKTKPSWYLVATDDKMIPPPAQRFMSERAGSTVVEAAGSHAIYVSQPKAVAELIEKAAQGVAVATA
jgi:pimeloyl-ACP methyl ester carboxylesterase